MLRALALGALAALPMGWALSAWGHVEVGVKSLQQHVAEADLVVVARIVDGARPFVLPDGRQRRPLVEASVLETLKGEASFARIRFAQHGHGVAAYQAGQQAVLFLRRIDRSRELRALAVPGGPSHYSAQEHDAAFLVEPPSGEVLVEAVRAYARAEAPDTPALERRSWVRRATLSLLTSGDVRLGASALASLVVTPARDLLEPGDRASLEAVVDDARLSVGYRAGLLAELERRGLVEGDARWRKLVESVPAEDLPRAVRAVSQHPGPAVEALLVDLMKHPEVPVAAEATRALGRAGRADLVPRMVEALAHADPRVRNAAIRGLRGIGGPEARRVLLDSAAEHADARTRRRARAAAISIAER